MAISFWTSSTATIPLQKIRRKKSVFFFFKKNRPGRGLGLLGSLSRCHFHLFANIGYQETFGGNECGQYNIDHVDHPVPIGLCSIDYMDHRLSIGLCNIDNIAHRIPTGLCTINHIPWQYIHCRVPIGLCNIDHIPCRVSIDFDCQIYFGSLMPWPS